MLLQGKFTQRGSSQDSPLRGHAALRRAVHSENKGEPGDDEKHTPVRSVFPEKILLITCLFIEGSTLYIQSLSLSFNKCTNSQSMLKLVYKNRAIEFTILLSINYISCIRISFLSRVVKNVLTYEILVIIHTYLP